MLKNGLLTLLFAFIPGAGQMYQGYMKRGLSLMLMCCVIGVLAMLFAPIALFLMLVFMYSFFDTLNLRAQIALGNAPADDYLVHLDPKDKRLARLLLDSHKLVGWLLIAFGALIAYQNLIMNTLGDLVYRWGHSSPVFRALYLVMDSLPDVVVYPDTTEQVEELVRYAAEHKLPLYVYGGGSSVTRGVEPIKGGTLAALPADAAAPLRALHSDASDASWSLRWVAGHPNVHVVLSGMSAEEQLADNLTTFDHFVPLSPAEDAAVEQAAAVLHSRIKIGCTGCRYCMPCPMGVDIPDNFSIWNKLGMFQQPEAIKAQWTLQFPDNEKASRCIRCGKCETMCPQKLPIRASLARLQEELDAL